MSKISYYIAIPAAGKANEADARAEGLLVSAFGTKRTSRALRHTSVNNPERTSRHARRRGDHWYSSLSMQAPPHPPLAKPCLGTLEDRLFNGGRWQLVAEFVEIESGRRAKRPQLDAALAACKKNKAKLVVAKLDRLSRNVSFLLKLIDSGVDVLFADLPELNGAMGRFMLTTMASVAE
jgi:Resolvase, N terminal domain